MADPIVHLERELHSLLKGLNLLRRQAVSEHELLQQLKGLLRQFQQNSSAIKDQRIMQATRKSVERQSFKLIRRAERMQRLLLGSRENFKEALDTFFNLFEPKYKIIFERTPLLDELQGYSNYLLRHVSKKDGIISTAIRERRLADVVEPLVEATEKALWPLLGILDQIESYFRDHELEYKVAIGEAMNFTLDMDAVFQRQGVNQVGTIIMDADFAHLVARQKESSKKANYNIKVPSGRILIPGAVFGEMTFKPLFAGRPLVSRQLLDYLRSILGARVVQVQVPAVTKDLIFRAWSGTAKGGRATQRDEEKFEHSGDMEIIGLALQQRGTIIILSNDNDVAGIVRNLGVSRIKVFSYRQGQLSLVA